jgi:putative membrane protein
MAAKDFFSDEARKRVGEAVETIEKDSEVEVVVSVRKRVGHYRRTDLYTGAVLAYLMLFFAIFDPEPVAAEWIAVDVVATFLVGVALSLEVPPLRRRLTPANLLDEATRLAAHSAFYTQGVSRTTGRTGVLVFVAMFEQRVFVVPDVGVKTSEMGSEWTSAVAALEASVKDTPDFDRFLSALGSLKGPLTRALPAVGGHKNQLADEPVMA